MMFMAARIFAGELLMTDIDARLREDVHLLGELLGNTIREPVSYTHLTLPTTERV